jgi:ATP-dependent protease ClpP protease subunit
MDEVPNRFVTICMGKAISCGAILLSHGDLRFCGRLSRVMVHNISMGSWGDAYALKADSDETLRMNKRFMGLLAENCGITYAELQHLIKDAVGSKEIWMDAESAQKFNIVDEVGIPRISTAVQWAFEVPSPKPRMNRKKGTTRKKAKKTK